MQDRKRAFHTIDALRFLAFFKVYLLHFPVQRDFFILSFLKRGGGVGVVFFFVLSGFLITHNLVSEQQLAGRINLRRFYLKRVLRIWPLFFLFLLFMYLPPLHFRESLGLIMPGYPPDWRFSFAFLENYKIILSHSFPALAPVLVTWSLCLEEHFYIIWGLMAALTTFKQMRPLLLVLIEVAILSRILCGIYLPQYDISTNEIITSLDYFAVGGLLGYLYAVHARQFDSFILSIPLFLRWSYVALTLIFVFTHFLLEPAIHLPKYLAPTFESIIFAGLIAIVLPQKSEIRIGENNVLSYLGRISYGLYLFHMILVDMFLRYCATHHLRIDTVRILAVDIAFTFWGTVLIAAVLYRWYERPIMDLRKYL